MARARSRVVMVVSVGAFLAACSCLSMKEKADSRNTGEAPVDEKVVTKVEKIPGGHARLGEVVGVIDAPRERVWKVISDYNNQKHFMPNLLESFILRPEVLQAIEGSVGDDLPKLESELKKYKTDQVDGEVLYMYGVGDFPWPMPNRRYILKIERDPEHYTTRSTMVIGQMATNETSWELKNYGGDGSKTLATYKVLLDTGTAVPAFAVELAANSVLPKVINAVRTRVKDAKYN